MKTNQKYSYDYRYPSNWLDISRKNLQKYPICVLCHVSPAKETHHIYYRLNRGHGELLLDKGISGKHWVSVCLRCHKTAHQIKGGGGRRKITYLLHPTDNSFNRNTPAFARQLKLGFKILYGDN